MIGTVIVMEPEDYQAWLSGGGTEGTLAQTGEKLFTELACVTCHMGGDQQRGPSLAGLIGSTVQLASGEKITATPEYVRESILDPMAKIVAGFPPIMPTFQGQVSEEQVLALTEYIKSLPARSDAGAESGTAPSSATPESQQPQR